MTLEFLGFLGGWSVRMDCVLGPGFAFGAEPPGPPCREIDHPGLLRICGWCSRVLRESFVCREHQDRHGRHGMGLLHIGLMKVKLALVNLFLIPYAMLMLLPEFRSSRFPLMIDPQGQACCLLLNDV